MAEFNTDSNMILEHPDSAPSQPNSFQSNLQTINGNHAGGAVILVVKDSIVHVTYLKESDEFEAKIPNLAASIKAPRGQTIPELASKAEVLLEMMHLEAANKEEKQRERKGRRTTSFMGAEE